MKTKTTKTTTQPSEDIQALANDLWRQAGCPAGRDMEFWLKAEDQIDSQSRASATIAKTPSSKVQPSPAKPAAKTRKA